MFSRRVFFGSLVIGLLGWVKPYPTKVPLPPTGNVKASYRRLLEALKKSPKEG